MAKCIVVVQCLFILLVNLTRALSLAPPGQHVLGESTLNVKKTLSFDDLPAHSALNKLTDYSLLTFSSFTLTNTSMAAGAHLIDSFDQDCAISPPNALIASRHHNRSLWPRITLNASTASAHGVAPFFNLHGLSMKPMNRTLPWTRMGIDAYGILDGEVLTYWSLYSAWPWPGHQQSRFTNISAIFPGWGQHVNMVQIYSESNADEDWHFCVDDVVVEFLDPEDENLPKAGMPIRSMNVELQAGE